MGAPASRQSWQRKDANRSSAGASAVPQARQMLFDRPSFVTYRTILPRSDGTLLTRNLLTRNRLTRNRLTRNR